MVFSVQVTVCAFLLTQPYLFHNFASRTITAVCLVALLFPVAWIHQLIAAPRRRGPEAVVDLPGAEPLKRVA